MKQSYNGRLMAGFSFAGIGFMFLEKKHLSLKKNKVITEISGDPKKIGVIYRMNRIGDTITIYAFPERIRVLTIKEYKLLLKNATQKKKKRRKMYMV